MIVTCPACSTRYLVDPRALGNAGRTVRCANCAETWHQTPPEDFPRTLDPPRPEVESIVGPPGVGAADGGGRVQLPAVIKPRRPWAAIVSIALLAVVLATVLAAVVAHDRVIAIWPQSMPLFAMIGLQPSSPTIGLEIGKLNTRRGSENGVAALLIDGEVDNVSGIVRDVPTLTATLRDANDKDLESWGFATVETRLLPGGVATFHTAIPQPNAAAVKAVVGWAAPE
jgi:predicted Zn finger-like uncharacterized protein